MTFIAILFASFATAAEVTVHYYNEAGIPEKALGQAIETANSVLRRAEVRVRWVDCYRQPKACQNGNALEVSIVEKASTVRNASFSMGYSLLPAGGTGVYATVMWNRVRRYAETFDMPAIKVLGNAIAHEIGHLLLGTGEHSREGIMMPSWTGREKVSLMSGRLQFQGHEATKMRRRVVEMASR
jgi:hypothetical protein